MSAWKQIAVWVALSFTLAHCSGKKEKSTEFEGASDTASTNGPAVTPGQKTFTGQKKTPEGQTGTIVLDKGESVATEVNTQSLELPSGVRPAGPPVHSNQQSTGAQGQIVLSIPYDPNYKQTSLVASAPDQSLVTVLYQVELPSGGSLIGAIPNNELTFNGEYVTFVSRGEGNYQAAVMPEPVTKEVTKEVSTPVYNPSQPNAVAAPTAQWDSIVLTRPSGRNARLTAQYNNNEVTLSRCVVMLDESKSYPYDQVASVSSFDVTLTVSKFTAHTTYGHFECQDSLGRSVESPWSNGVAIPEAPLPAVTMSLAGPAADDWVNNAEKNSAVAWFTQTTQNTASIFYSNFQSMPSECSPAQDYSLASPPKVSDLSADGTFWICVKAVSSDYRVKYFTSPSFTRDTVAPSVNLPLIPNSGGTVDLAAAIFGESTISWSASGGSFSDSTVAATQFSAPASGSYTITVAASDEAGNSASASQVAVIDMDPPVVASFTVIDNLINISESVSQGANPLFAISVTDASAYSISYSGFLSSGACDASQNYSSASIPLVSALTSPTNVYICAKVTDAFGHATYAVSASTRADLIAPSIAIDALAPVNVANKVAFILSGTCSEDTRTVTITGAVSASTTCNSGSWSRSVDLSANGDGTLNFTAAISDSAGNAANASASTSMDATPPVATVSGQPSGPSNLASISVTIGGGVTDFQYALSSTNNCAAASYSATQSASGSQTIAGIGSLPDGPVYLCVRGVDAAGNWQAKVDATSVSWIKDTTAPTVTINALAAVSSGNVASFPISGTCSENGRMVNLSGAASASVSCSGGSWAMSPNVSAAAQGNLTFTASQSDVAGNTGTVSANTTKDTLAPTAPLSNAPTGTIYNQAALNVIVNGPETTHYKYALIAATNADCASASYGAETPFATHITDALTSAPGTTDYTLCVIARDAYNNWQTNAAATKAIWTLANSTVTIGSAPSYAHSQNYAAFPISGTCLGGTGTVVIKFGATAIGSPVSCTANAWSASLNLTALSDSATPYAVTAEYSSKVSSSVSVIKDITPPSPSTLSATVASSTSVSLSWPGSTDLVSGGSLTYHVYYSSSSAMATLTEVEGATSFSSAPSATNIDVTGLTSNTPYNFNVVIQDQAGNKAIYAPANATPSSGGGSPHFAQIAAGEKHSCALDNSGRAFCWGQNNYGQLGDGTTYATSPKPIMVSGGHTFTSIYVGSEHSCALTAGGAAYCWGLNDFGQLGDNTQVNKSSPTLVSGGLTFSKLSLGSFKASCGIASSDGNKGYCWGSGTNGKLGNGSTTTKTSPTVISTLSALKDIALGLDHACVIDSSDDAYCWGNNSYGILGNGTIVGSFNTPQGPITIAGPTNLKLKKISSGQYFSCGITTSDEISCWGSNVYGQIGANENHTSTLKVPTPTKLKDASSNPIVATFTQISSFKMHACALTDVQKVYCWGNDAKDQGAIAGSLTVDYAVEKNLSGETYKQISAGTHITCGITNANVGKCWGGRDDDGGATYFGLLGDNIADATQSATPVVINTDNL